MVEKGLAKSRERARALIMAGRVLVGEERVDKPGYRVAGDLPLALKGGDIPYVSRGGLKLEHALKTFDMNAEGLVCMDVGASTGGFTDCLLQYGAKKVYAVDVGYGQLAWKLRQEPRVVVIERTNIRNLEPDYIDEPPQLTVIDVSFISLKIVVPAVLSFMKTENGEDSGRIVALIKPQFEVGRQNVGKGGVVRDDRLRWEAVYELKVFFQNLGLVCGPVTESPISGPRGNREFLILLYVASNRE